MGTPLLDRPLIRPSVSLRPVYRRRASPNDASPHATDQTFRHHSRPSRHPARYASTTSDARSPRRASPASNHRIRPSISLRPAYRRRASPNDASPQATDQTSRHQSRPSRHPASYASITSDARSPSRASPASNHRIRPSVSLNHPCRRRASPNDASPQATDQTSRHRSYPARHPARYASITSNARSTSPGSPASNHRIRPSVSLRPVYRRRACPNDASPQATDQTSRHQSRPSRHPARYASTTSDARSPSPVSPASNHRIRPSVSLNHPYCRRASRCVCVLVRSTASKQQTRHPVTNPILKAAPTCTPRPPPTPAPPAAGHRPPATESDRPSACTKHTAATPAPTMLASTQQTRHPVTNPVLPAAPTCTPRPPPTPAPSAPCPRPPATVCAGPSA